jgi:hypothetical protein
VGTRANCSSVPFVLLCGSCVFDILAPPVQMQQAQIGGTCIRRLEILAIRCFFALFQILFCLLMTIDGGVCSWLTTAWSCYSLAMPSWAADLGFTQRDKPCRCHSFSDLICDLITVLPQSPRMLADGLPYPHIAAPAPPRGIATVMDVLFLHSHCQRSERRERRDYYGGTRRKKPHRKHHIMRNENSSILICRKLTTGVP